MKTIEKNADALILTKNDIPEKARESIVELLNDRLADAIDLQLQSKQAHWNVKGIQFIALHKLFDEIHTAAQEYVDQIAERAVQLGGVALGTVRGVAARTDLPDYPTSAHRGEEHVEALSNSLAAFGKNVREAIERADDLKDKDTADVFTEISRGTDQWLWFVEAHQQVK